MAKASGSPIEIVDADAAYRDRPGQPTRRWGWVAALVGAVVVVAVTLSLLSDDPPPPPPAPSPGIFALGVADAADSPPSNLTTYPVLGREWGQTLLWVQQGGIVAFDLDTGASWLWLPNDTAVAPGWSGIAFVDGVAHVTFGAQGVARVDGSAVTVVVEDPNSAVFGAPSAVVGEYAVVHDESFAPSELRHLVTSSVVALDGATNAAVLGADVLLERNGQIRRLTADGDDDVWAEGELLWGGAQAVVWRACAADRCTAWAGTADDPRALPLDEPAVAREEARVQEVFPEPIGALIDQSKGSPDGRYAGSLDGRREPTWRLIDLVDGSDVTLLPPGLPTAWTADGTVFARFMAPALALVSMADGQAARLPLLTTAGPRWNVGAVFVPTDELPVIE